MDAQPPHRRLLVARAFGIPVYVHFSWVIVFALITWTLATGYFPAASPDLPALSHWARAFVASLLFFVSILLHEMGHALVAVRRGVPIRTITLFIFGGVSEMQRDPGDGRTELQIAIAGPVVSLALAGVFWAVGASGLFGEAVSSVTRYLALINLLLAAFNLVPAFPLDGGRLLRGLLWSRVGKARATRVAAGAGSFFAFLLMGLGILQLLGGQGIGGVWYILIGWFLQEASAGAYRGARLDEALLGVRVRDAMLAEVATIPAHLSLAEASREHFLHTGYGGYPVVRGDAVVGLLGLRDVLRHPPDERETLSVQAAMAPIEDALVVGPEEPLRAAVARMAERGVGRLLVIEDGRLVGLITMSAVMRQIRVREQLAA
jgi:Zn-dependent protease/CBS domain-containing protein